ncbi:MAG: IS1595 family transposase [Gammaproteobacteria bacterium]|nr:IS1595 family transposase [Gammaproteobacteria bacterium]MDE0248224.1 IS1595 family transposase [Gammaproteobacteria bacterium]
MPQDRKQYRGPGKAYRTGITLLDLARMFPTEESAVQWFERVTWANGRCCGHCGGLDTRRTKSGKPQPYFCRDCKRYFSLRTGTVMANSKLPIRTWVYAIYLNCTSLKGVSSMKLHRDLGITQKSTWHLQQLIRESFNAESPMSFGGPIEVDEVWVGGRKPRHLPGRGPIGKTPVVGAKDRATNQVTAHVIKSPSKGTLHSFVNNVASDGAEVYTDGSSAYRGRQNHEWVNHSAGEYVKGKMVHTNGIESFWSLLKRAHKGTFHKMSPKHLQRYVTEFVARHNIREWDTMEQMQEVVARMVGRQLTYRDLIRDNGLPSGARSG